MNQFNALSNTVQYCDHRYHVVWITKYRFKVLKGAVQQRVREIIRQVCDENDVEIISGVLSGDHVHMFVSIPPKLSVSNFMRKVKGRSSHRNNFFHMTRGDDDPQ